MLLACRDELSVWIICDNIEIRIAYGQAIEWIRELKSHETDWAALFEGNLHRGMSLNLRLSGNLDRPPFMWISSDATIKRVGAINWRAKQFMGTHIGNLFGPFASVFTQSIHVSDVELLAIILCVAVWVTLFRGTAVGISDNLDAFHRLASQRAHHGAPLQILRTALKWLEVKNIDLAGLYGKSSRNMSAGHLARLTHDEIDVGAEQVGLEWASPFAINGNWMEFTNSVAIGR